MKAKLILIVGALLAALLLAACGEIGRAHV